MRAKRVRQILRGYSYAREARAADFEEIEIHERSACGRFLGDIAMRAKGVRQILRRYSYTRETRAADFEV